MLFYTRIVDVQELGRTGSHVGIEMLSLGTLSVNELKDGVIFWSIFQKAAHHLKQSFPKMRRTLLGDVSVG